MNLTTWCARVGNWKRTKSDQKPLEAHILHLHEEVSEVGKALRELGDDSYGHVYFSNGHPEGFGIELADVVLIACYIAQATGINLEEQMEVKMRYNESRRAK